MYKYRYVIIRVLIMAALFVIGLSVGLANRKTRTVWVEIPIEGECDCKTEMAPQVDVVKSVEEKYKEIEVVATAYCPCYECSEGYGNQTSTGAIAKEGRTIAVDPKIIPYGTEVVIDGKTYVAEDCGGLIKGNEIDVYFDNHKDVDNFGKKNLKVQIKEVAK